MPVNADAGRAVISATAPRRSSARHGGGQSPSPQALSGGNAALLEHQHRSPGSAATIAAASPRGRRRRRTSYVGRASPLQQHQLAAEARAHRQKTPYVPRARRPRSSRSAATKSTDADERLPISRSELHERGSASAGSSSAPPSRCSTLGPPVWAIQWRTSARARGRARRGSASTASRRWSATRSGIPPPRTTWKPPFRDLPAHHLLGVGEEERARGEDARARGAAAGAAREHHRRRAVAEERRGDDVGDRAVLAPAA